MQEVHKNINTNINVDFKQIPDEELKKTAQ